MLTNILLGSFTRFHFAQFGEVTCVSKMKKQVCTFKEQYLYYMYICNLRVAPN